MKSKQIRRSAVLFTDEDDVNPMDYLSNLSDVMLVLAVGMMLALVVAWNVDLVGIGNSFTEAGVEGEVELERQVQGISGTDGQKPEDYGLTEYGTVYVDEEGNLYVIGDTEE